MKKVIVAITMLATLVYLGWRALFTMPDYGGAISAVLWIVLAIVEFTGCLETLVSNWNILMMDKPEKMPKCEKWKAVDVLIPTLDEPADVIEKTIEACKAMKYNGKVRICILDDSNRDWLRRLCEKLAVDYFARKEHKWAKAGNLNFGLKKTDAPAIAVFDADMRPKKDFLVKTIPWLRGDVAFVQTPQSFWQKDIFQRVWKKASGDQDFFYQVIQKSREKSNTVIFGGSNAVMSRKALEKIGGFVEGTLTEDFATGIELEKAGYRGVAVTEALAEGQTPQTLRALVKQRVRWARGCIQSGWRTNYVLSNLTLGQRINYACSIGYWYWSWRWLVCAAMPMIYALTGATIMKCQWRELLVFWLPMAVMNAVNMHVISDGKRNVVLDNVFNLTLAPFLALPVLAESFGFRRKNFGVTSKEKEKENPLYLLPFLVGIGASVLCCFMMFKQIQQVDRPAETLAEITTKLDEVQNEITELETCGAWDERIAKKHARLIEKKIKIETEKNELEQQLQYEEDAEEFVPEWETLGVDKEEFLASYGMTEEQYYESLGMSFEDPFDRKVNHCLIIFWLIRHAFYCLCCCWVIIASLWRCRNAGSLSVQK